jgi:aspartyl-tRNA(Asn)/glutamyl-tRNA(Gln) amidotransferase subunit A
METLVEITHRLAKGETNSRDLVEQCLGAISDQNGEGARTFITYDAEKARATADAMDVLRKTGYAPSAFAGIPISVKDLFDIQGEVTTAGSILLQNSSPATHDAISISMLRNAGFIFLGRTNMTEFAYSGLGLNSHYGTPKNPFDRKIGRIPGGSSSGAAVSVSDGMAMAAIGTDTGGSIRIPAALCGLVGFKPTARRVSTKGVYPLCQSLDSVGPIALSVSCCAAIDKILSASEKPIFGNRRISGLSLGIPQTYVLDNLESEIATSFERAIKKISEAGAHISEIPLTCLADIPKINSGGGIYAEAWAVHQEQFVQSRALYDRRVADRLELVSNIRSSDYIKVLGARRSLIDEANNITANLDALILPTTPSVAPTISELEENDSTYLEMNARMLRNCFCFNFLDRCALSIPCHEPGSSPSGLMLVGESYGDNNLLEIGIAIEKIIKFR